jgi:hypothetical protein
MASPTGSCVARSGTDRSTEKHVWAAADLDDPGQRIREASRLLPRGGAVGGWAAAYLLGAREVDGLDPTHLARAAGEVTALPSSTRAKPRGARAVASGLVPVLLCTGPGKRIRAQIGVRLMRSRLDASDVVDIDGIPVTSPERTAFDLARGLDGFRTPDRVLHVMNAVSDVDAVLRVTRSGAAVVRDYADKRPGWKGAPFARQVLALADADALSRTESALRVVWVMLAGLPRPVLNRPVHDGHGFLLGYPDLLDPASGLIAESDGSHHRRLDQHTADNAREEDFERHNLHVVRATSLDLYRRRGALTHRLVAGYRDARARDVRRDDWVVGTEPMRLDRRP